MRVREHLPEQTLHGLLALRAAERAADAFLIFEEETWTFAEVYEASRQLAGGLAKIGVKQGDKVALMMSNRPEFLFTWFALSMLGAIEVPINTAHRGDLLRYFLAQADCTTLVVEREFVAQIEAIAGELPNLRQVVLLGSGEPASGQISFEELRRASPLKCVAPVGAADPIAIMFTSGTTGPSKGAVLPQAYVLNQAAIIVEACRYTPKDRLFNALPLFHGNAQFLSAAPALLAGASMVLARRFSASSFWDEVRRHSCTEFNYIGGILPILMKAPPSPRDSDHSLRLMMGAGAPRDLFTAFEQRFGVQLVEGYGMSEIGIPFINEIDTRKPGSCGKPFGMYEARLVDDDGAEIGPGEVGELWLRPKRTNSMMLEYYGMPEKTVEAWRDLWFHTGDYLRKDEEGCYYFVDRKKDALRRRGENISSYEVERSVNEHPAVLESAAVAVASDLGEDEVMICVALREGATLAPIDLLRHCAEKMAGFMVPRYVRILARLPKTPTERVQKFTLRAEGATADTYDREQDSAWRQLTEKVA